MEELSEEKPKDHIPCQCGSEQFNVSTLPWGFCSKCDKPIERIVRDYIDTLQQEIAELKKENKRLREKICALCERSHEVDSEECKQNGYYENHCQHQALKQEG